MLELNTFSISARCGRTGMLGVAVATAVPAVGGICPFVESAVGAISTQSWVNPYLGIDGLALLRNGASAPAALDILIANDPGRDVRQLGIVDAQGRSSAWSGAQCTPWFGHRTGPGYAVQGNMLTGPEVIDGMEQAFLASSDQDLPERLVRVLEAGQRGHGDKRGRQSAALSIFKGEAYPYLSLRIDEHATPIAELRRVLGIARLQLLPFVEGMPKRSDPIGGIPKEVTDMLLMPPPLRPGGGGSAPD
jgi:uncharacterized Ntn-hydrolase superfamily protein